MGKMLTFDRMVVESRNSIFLPKWPQLNSYKISSRASKFSLKCFLNRLIGQLVILSRIFLDIIIFNLFCHLRGISYSGTPYSKVLH